VCRRPEIVEDSGEKDVEMQDVDGDDQKPNLEPDALDHVPVIEGVEKE
jgi:hypothetical protein